MPSYISQESPVFKTSLTGVKRPLIEVIELFYNTGIAEIQTPLKYLLSTNHTSDSSTN
jgi:hypothetical protein